MRVHTEDDCRPTLGIGSSFEAWLAIENTYRVIIYAPVADAVAKILNQRSEAHKSKAVFTGAIQTAIVEFL